MNNRSAHLGLLLLILAGCTGDSLPDTADTADTADTDDTEVPDLVEIAVEVTLDGAPLAGAVVVQGGIPGTHITDENGAVTMPFDPNVGNSLGRAVISSHPEARTGSAIVRASDEGAHVIAMTRFQVGDNTNYVFQDPGEPERRATTAVCAHCHVSLNKDWYGSAHRTSASNPTVRDLYDGSAAALNQQSCDAVGGQWLEGMLPGTVDPAERCYVGQGTLPTLNPGCDPICDGTEDAFGGCADCHAPGIDGDAGGRDLTDAHGVSHDFGVHCDVCHKVESVDLMAPPGVGGRLVLNRPLEPTDNPNEPWAPLMFGPYDDVPHSKMGAVPRPVFREAALCAGCHQQEQAVLVPNATIDTERWPAGVLPIHSTYEEWLEANSSPALACQGCHMPGAPEMGNAADLGNEFDIDEGVAGGWYRPAGEVRHHTWRGPRNRDSGMLELAATVTLAANADGTNWVVSATVKNVGPAHAIPTGEPMRSLVLSVRASCDGNPLTATGGDAIPDFGGALSIRTSAESWDVWPGATVGNVVRVVRHPGQWRDYTGFGPFGDGRFTAEQKGMRVQEVVGQSTIVSVSNGVVAFDQPLPAGDVAMLGSAGWPQDEATAVPLAGSPGMAFARVLTGASGARMVPHYLAVDVASDNRILPGQSATSEHHFDASACSGTPLAEAVLVHRAYPLALAQERGWTLVDSVMAEAQR